MATLFKSTEYPHRRRYLQRWGIAIALALLSLVHFACQLPTQPTNLTANAPTTVIVEDQGNNPVKDKGVSVQWRVLNATNSIWHTMSPANPPIYDGTFADVVPIPIGDDTSRVAFQVNAPSGYAPAMQLDTEIGYCGSKVFTFHVSEVPITITACDPTAWTSSITLIANEPSSPIVSAITRTFTNSYKGLNFSYSSNALPTGPGLPKIDVYSIISGTQSTLSQTFSAPTPISIGTSYFFRFQFTTDPKATQNSSKQYVVTIIGVDPSNGDTCVNILDTLNTQIKVQTPCDCPTGTFEYFDKTSTCVAASVSDTVSLKNISNSNTQCTLVFSLAASSKLDNSVTLSPDLSQTPIQPNQNVPGTLIITFTPQTVKTYDVEYDYTITRRAPGGTTNTCDSILRIHFHGSVGTPECQFDLSPNSSILRDTMRQVINSDSSAGLKQFCVKNSGACPVSITAASIAGVSPNPFHIVTPLPVTVPPNNGSACVEVSFNPTDTDVWPHGRGAGVNPIDIFNATLRVTTSAGCDTTVNIVGKLTLPNYNNPCLQTWGTNKFFGGIVLDDSGTFTQSTDPTSPGGFSIYASYVDPSGASATLMSGGTAGGVGSYVTFATIDHSLNFAANDICELSGGYAGKCGTMAGTSSISGLTKGDVILFEYVDPRTGKQECGLIWITDITSTSGSGISVCFQMCFPI